MQELESSDKDVPLSERVRARPTHPNQGAKQRVVVHLNTPKKIQKHMPASHQPSESPSCSIRPLRYQPSPSKLSNDMNREFFTSLASLLKYLQRGNIQIKRLNIRILQMSLWAVYPHAGWLDQLTSDPDSHRNREVGVLVP